MERDFHDANSKNDDIRKSDYSGNNHMEINNLYMNNNMNSCSILENMKYNQNVFNENDINLYKYNLMLKRNNMHIHDTRKNLNNIITPNNNSSSSSGLVNDKFYNNVGTYNMLNLNNTSFMQNPKQLNNTTHCHNDINNMKNVCLNKNLYENCDTQNNMQFCNYTKSINGENKYSYHSLNSDNPLFQLQMDSYVDEADNSKCENSNVNKQLVRNMNTHNNLTHIREREIMNSTCNNNLVKAHEEKFLNSSQSVLNNKINISQTNQNLNNDNITNKLHFINNFNIDNKSLNENIANNNYSNNSTAHGVKSQDDQGMQTYMDIHEDQYISSNGVYGNNNDHLNANLFNNNLYFPSMQINNNKAEINGKNNKHDNKISELNTTPNKYESLIRIGIKHMIGNKNSTELKNNTNLNKINLSASSALCSPINGNKNNIKFSKCVNEKNDYIVISPNNNNLRNITNNNNFENIKNIPNIVDTGDIIDISNTSNIDESEYLNNTTEAIGNIEANSLAHKKKVNNNSKAPLNIYINSDSNNITKDIDNSSNENIIGAKHTHTNINDNLAETPNVKNINKINFTNVNSLSTLNVFTNNNSQRSFSNSSNSSHSNNSIQIVECENKKGDLNNNKNINNNVCTNKIVNNANTNNNIESFDSNSFPYAKYIINNSCTMKNIGHNNNSNCNGMNFNKNGMYIENRNIHDTDSKLYNNLNHFHNNLNIHNSQNLRKTDNTISRNSNDNNNYMHTYNNFSNNGNNIYNNINSNNNGYLKQKNKEIIINHQNDRTNLNNDVFINLDNSTNTSLSNSAPFGTILNTHLNHRQNNSNKINPDILINKGVNPNHISNVINNGNKNNPNYMTKGLRNGNNNSNVLINDVTNINSKKTGKHINNFMNGLANNNGFNLYNNIDMGVNKNTENNNGSIGNMNKMFSTHTNMNSDLKNTMNNLNDNNKGMGIKPSVTNFASINQTSNNYNTKKYVYPSNINPNMDGYSLKNDNAKDRSLTDGNMINVMRRVGINEHFMNKNMVHNLANNGNEIENMSNNLSNNMTNNLQLINNNISINRSSDINKYKNELLNNLNDFSNRNDGDHLILNREHPEMFNDGSNKIFYKDIINNNMNINMNNKNMANCNNNGMLNYMENSSINRTNINGNGKKGGSISIDNNGNHIPINNLQNNVALNGNYDLLKIRNMPNDDNKLNSIDIKNNLNNLTNIDNFQNKIQLRQRTHGCSENGGPNNNVRNNSTGMNNRNTANLNGVLNIGNINYNKFYDTTQQNSRIQKNNNRQNNPNINGIPNNGNSMNDPSNIYSAVNHLNGNINRNNLNVNEVANNNNKIHSLNNNVAKQAFDGRILMRNKCASNDIKYSQNEYEIGNGINKIGHTSSNSSSKIGKYDLNLKNKGTLSRSNTTELPTVFNKNEYLCHAQNNNNKYPDMYNNNIVNAKNQLINSNNSVYVKNGVNNGNEYQMANNINKNNLFKVDNVNRINNKDFNNSANANNINNYNDVRKNSYQIVNDNSGGFNENEKGNPSNYIFEHNEYKERNRNSMYDIETDKLVKNENVNNRRGSDYINNNFSSAYSAMIENYNRNNMAKYEFNKIVNMVSKGDLNNSLNLKNLVNINKNFNILMNNLDSQNGGNYVNHDTKENCNINIGDNNNNNKFYNGNNHKIYVQDNNKKNIQPNNLNIYNENNIVDINLLNKNNKKNNMIPENMNANNISLDNIGFKLRMQKNGYINNDNNISGISDMANFDNQDNLMYILNRNNNILMKNGKAGYMNSQLNNDGVLGLNNRMNFNTMHNNMTNINNHNVDHLILNNSAQGQSNNDQMLKFSMNQNFQEIKNGCIKIGNKRKQMEPSKTIDLANIDEHQFLNNGKKNVRKKKKESVNTSSGSSGNDVLLSNPQNKILGKMAHNMFPKNNTARLSIDLNNNVMQNMNYSELDTNHSPYITPDGNILSNWGTTPKQITEHGSINSEAELLNNSIKENIQTVDINYVIHNNVVGNVNSNAFPGNHISMNSNLKNNNNNIIYKESGSGNSQNNASNTKDINTMMMGSTSEFYHKIKTSDNDVNTWTNKNGVIPRKNDQFQLSSFSGNMKWNEIENGQKEYQQDVSFPNTKISEHSVTDSTSSDYKNEEHDLKEKQVQKSLEYIDKHIANYENLITNLSFINDKENKEMKTENDQIYNGLMNSIVANINAENLTGEKNGIESGATIICKNINELFDNKDENEKINNNQTENVMENLQAKENISLKDTQNEINKMDDNNSNDFSDSYEEKEFEDNMNKHVFFKNKKQYETFIMFNEINVSKDNINLFMSMNISSYNQNCREQNEAYNLYLENEEGKEMHGDQIENISASNILDENCHNTDKYNPTNENINISENEMIKNNMLRSLLSINSKEEIKKIIENKIFGKNNENKKIVFSVVKQIDDAKFLYILKVILKEQNINCNKNKIKVLKIQKRKILYKTFYQKSNKSKALTLEYILKADHDDIGEMNCLVRSEECLLEGDREKRNIEKIINANFEITTTTVSMATPTIVNLFKNDYVLQNSYYCDFWSFYLCLNDQFNATIEFHQNKNKANGNKAYKLNIRAHCENYETFFENFIEFLV